MADQGQVQEKKRGWLGRNWTWFVPAGCLSIIVLVLGGFALLVVSAFGIMKSSDAYKDAMARVTADTAVQAALGTPIEAGRFVTGNINVNGPSGQANLSIPVSGPKGKAKVQVVATKSAGKWMFSTLVVETEGTGERIDLLGAPPVLAPLEIPGTGAFPTP